MSRLTQGVLYAVAARRRRALAFAADWAAIKQNFFDGERAAGAVARRSSPSAAKNTVVYTAIAFAGGLVLALVLALMKLSPVGPYRWIATAYIEFFRGLPALLVILAFGFGIPIAFHGSRPVASSAPASSA